MSEVNFTLTKKNFKLLIEHVFIGNWILNATKIDRDKKLDDFYNTILSIGKNYNIVDGIIYDKDSGEFDLDEELEEKIISKIEDYEDESFWEALINKLAARDVVRKYGVIKLREMDQIERMKKIWEEEEKYHTEFEKNGLENLKLTKN